MLPEFPETPESRIIQLHVHRSQRTQTGRGATAQARLTEQEAQAQVALRRVIDHRRDSGRHFLKFTLPAIPITTFVISFLFWYLAEGLRTPTFAKGAISSVDATIPLVGATVLGLFTAMLCFIIYLGYLNAREKGL